MSKVIETTPDTTKSVRDRIIEALAPRAAIDNDPTTSNGVSWTASGFVCVDGRVYDARATWAVPDATDYDGEPLDMAELADLTDWDRPISTWVA